MRVIYMPAYILLVAILVGVILSAFGFAVVLTLLGTSVAAMLWRSYTMQRRAHAARMAVQAQKEMQGRMAHPPTTKWATERTYCTFLSHFKAEAGSDEAPGSAQPVSCEVGAGSEADVGSETDASRSSSNTCGRRRRGSVTRLGARR